MKNFKPTLVFLSFLCLFEFSNAQKNYGFNIQKKQNLTDHAALLEQHVVLEDEIPDSTEESSLNRLLPITYTYDDGWIPSNPIGVASSIDTILIESGTVNISANTVCDNLIVNPGASVTINVGAILTTAIIDLHSTSQLFSSLISDGVIIGTINYHRFASQIGTNDLISSPVSNQLFESFALLNDGTLAASGSIRAFAPYNTSVGAYQNYDVLTNALTTIESGKGYRVATNAGSTLTFTGVIRTDDVLDIPISDALPGDAWNLIGNPYPSYLNFETFFSLNKTQFDDASFQAIYGYDGDASDGWTVWNQAIIDAPATTELIAPGQAFFVKAKSGGGSIDFTKAMRCVGASDDFISGKTTESPHYGHLKIGLNSSNLSSNTDFYFNSNATLGFDPGYDAGFFGNPTSFSIYSYLVENNTGLPFDIQSLDQNAMYDVIVPLGINASQGQDLTISILQSDMPTTINVYLEDAFNNTSTLLNTTDYVFTPSADLLGIGRFYLRFSSDALNVTKSTLESLIIYSKSGEKTIVLSGELPKGTEAKLYDMNSRLVLSNIINANTIETTINASQLNAGIYILELSNGNIESRIQKLIIQ